MNSSVNRRLYISALSLAVLTLLLVRVFVLPRWGEGADVDAPVIAASVTDALLGAALASLCISALVILLFSPRTKGVAEAIVIESKGISGELQTAAEHATEWHYRGHTGRYFRTVILPSLVERSGTHGRYIHIRAQVLDPDDLSAIDFLVTYRRTVSQERAAYWTEDRARAEIIATLLALEEAGREDTRITCDVYLGSTVSPFTFDITSDFTIVTRESAEATALKYPSGSTFFDSALEDLQLGYRQARRLPLAPAPGETPQTVADVTKRLRALEIAPNATEELVAQILHCVQHPLNPYPNA